MVRKRNYVGTDSGVRSYLGWCSTVGLTQILLYYQRSWYNVPLSTAVVRATPVAHVFYNIKEAYYKIEFPRLQSARPTIACGNHLLHLGHSVSILDSAISHVLQ